MNEASAYGLELLREANTEIEPDLPPEYCHYRDDGCELSDSCLNCPFPQCVYDEPGGRQHWFKKLRDREIARLFSGGDKGVKELAQIFGLSQRSIQRALKNSISASNMAKAGSSAKGKRMSKGEPSGNE